MNQNTSLNAVVDILKEDLPADFKFERKWVDTKNGLYTFCRIEAQVRATSRHYNGPLLLVYKLDVIGDSLCLTSLDTAQMWDFDLADPKVFEKVRTRFSMELVK